MAQMEKITGGRTTGEKVKTGILGFFLNFLRGCKKSCVYEL